MSKRLLFKRNPNQRSLLVSLVLACVVQSSSTTAGADEPIQFNRDIRPILATHCFACHGPDSPARRGGLRLDHRERAIAPAESGRPAIVAEHPEQSELIDRILSNDPDLVMPPPSANKPLLDRQRELLQRWIAQGAKYEPHWALISAQRPPLPTVKRIDWPRNAIDSFILARLESESLVPSPTAVLPTLLRRLSLDLTGLPPTLDEVRRFTTEMEAARKADLASVPATSQQEDATYRRWVEHFLASPHYGERMAVDWLDAARFADTNGYQVDRDREMFAYRDWVIDAFNRNLPFDQFTIEQIAGDLLPDATFSQKIATGFHRNHMLNEEGGIIPEEFLVEYCADRVETTATVWLGQTFNCARCHDHKFDPFTQRDFYGLYAFFHNVNEQGIGNYGAHYRRNAPPFLKLPAPELEAKLVALKTEYEAGNDELTKIDSQLTAEQPQWEEGLRATLAATETQATESAPKIPDEIASIVKKTLEERSDGEKKKLTEHYQSTHAVRKPIADKVAALKKQVDETENQIPTTLVMEERAEPRETHILVRGVYNKFGDVVTANTPASLPPMNAEFPRNRLGLAKWLVDPANPLPSRIYVNRLWQSVFGVGLVSTAEDFGVQGEQPSHLELLDWLAVEFVQSGWNVKQMLTLMVSSATYRQTSLVTRELQERDPTNRFLARGPRFRLQSEFLRDQALAVSGLLSPKIGGPSVKPYHPTGLYEQVTAGSGTDKYVEGSGEDLFRRGMYSYWKRSVPQPAMLVFDAPFRETCTLRRPRTNTPLQALNLMNDPTYVEAARFLAVRMLTEAGAELDAQLSHGFQLVLARTPNPMELNVLRRAFQRAQDDYQADQAAATELLKIGTRRSPEELEPTRLAAMTMVGTTILNLDESVMKE